MLTLVETLTAFTAIMLMISLLVKTLTSVIKNQWDYFSDNLEHEVKRLVLEATGKAWEQILNDPATPPRVKDMMTDIHWERLGEEILTPAHMSWFLKQLDQNARVMDLESRLKIHVANVKYTFEMRMKNLALAVGLGMCLLCDVNAVTIWKSLYTDQQLRATFANDYAKKASDLSEKQAQAASGATGTTGTTAGAGTTNANAETPKLTKAQADAQLKEFKQDMQGFLTDVSFGVGRIWREECFVLIQEDRSKCLARKRTEKAEAEAAAAAANSKKATVEAGSAKKLADMAGEKLKSNATGGKPSDDDSNTKKIADDVAAKASQKAAEAQVSAESASAMAKIDAGTPQTKTEKEESVWEIFLYELFGSLLTGILVSIGAPYWHDILQALSSLRSTPAPAPAKAKV